MTLSAPVELPATSQTAPKKQSFTKLVAAVSIGNALEWYDISSYGYFAVYVSKAFFPNNDPTISLLLTFGTFGLAFLARPIGGLVLGAYADRHGRKASLMISIVMMTVGIGAQHEAADRASQERQSERAEGQEQRNGGIVVGKEGFRHIDGEIAIGGDVIPLQRISDRHRGDQLGEALLFGSCLRCRRQLNRRG